MVDKLYLQSVKIVVELGLRFLVELEYHGKIDLLQILVLRHFVSYVVLL
jgi:hypothetical protein